VEDAKFLFQPLKSPKDAEEAVFFGVFWRLFAVKINLWEVLKLTTKNAKKKMGQKSFIS
jgi:hypothetical protein